ncbi:MAG TPA: hypothetical protein VG846_07890 [Actinomycetota bacterium]|nr:hypothetical protein [Actinomycetota bacterium]
MSHLIVTTATRAPAFRDQDTAAPADRARELHPSRLWTLIAALAYAGAYVDPSGILAVERLRRAKEQDEQRNGR